MWGAQTNQGYRTVGQKPTAFLCLEVLGRESWAQCSSTPAATCFVRACWWPVGVGAVPRLLAVDGGADTRRAVRRHAVEAKGDARGHRRLRSSESMNSNGMVAPVCLLFLNTTS